MALSRCFSCSLSLSSFSSVGAAPYRRLSVCLLYPIHVVATAAPTPEHPPCPSPYTHTHHHHHHPPTHHPLKFCADQPTRSFTVHLGGVWCVAVRVLDGFCASAISRTPWRIAASLRLLAAPAPQLPHRHVGRYLHCRLGALCAPVSARRRLRAVVHLALESRLSSLGRAHLPLVLHVILHQYAAANQPINQPTMMCCSTRLELDSVSPARSPSSCARVANAQYAWVGWRSWAPTGCTWPITC